MDGSTVTQSDAHGRVVRALLDTIDELNKQLPKQARLDRSLDAGLTGSSGKLDSLGLINFIVIAEQKIEEEFGRRISLTDETIASRSPQVFSTIRTLSDYLSRILEEAQNV